MGHYHFPFVFDGLRVPKLNFWNLSAFCWARGSTLYVRREVQLFVDFQAEVSWYTPVFRSPYCSRWFSGRSTPLDCFNKLMN